MAQGTERLWKCCGCCDHHPAIVDHVEHGGFIEKDGHDGPCDICQPDHFAEVPR